VTPSPRRAKLVSRAELATLLEVHLRTVGTWVDEGMPVKQRRKGGKGNLYDPEACRAWREEHHPTTSESYNLPAEKARHERAQAVKTELQIAVQRGELVPREQAVREGQGFAGAVMARLLGLHRQLVQRGIVPPAREGEVRALVFEMLDEMRTWTAIDVAAILGAANGQPTQEPHRDDRRA
jgi:phage terminase Nu1 subunit (DNA packaging protein)